MLLCTRDSHRSTSNKIGTFAGMTHVQPLHVCLSALLTEGCVKLHEWRTIQCMYCDRCSEIVDYRERLQ